MHAEPREEQEDYVKNPKHAWPIQPNYAEYCSAQPVASPHGRTVYIGAAGNNGVLKHTTWFKANTAFRCITKSAREYDDSCTLSTDTGEKIMCRLYCAANDTGPVLVLEGERGNYSLSLCPFISSAAP